MIKLNRPNCPNQTELDTMKNGVSAEWSSISQPLKTSLKNALKEACCGKCMYCESMVSHTYFGDVEHIKPKDKFPNLKFDWDNLGFVCAKCNNAKSNKYDGDTPHINPYTEEPNDEIIFAGPMIFSKNGSERGKITILDIDLARVELFEKRKTRLEQIDKAIGQCNGYENSRLKADAIEELKKEASEDKEYSLCIKYLLKSHKIIE
ncbi:HNH endonuclease [bacterium BMS3Abin15]|nr:HNH endonuclease [bacterium BMS3Abin15]